MSLPVILRPEAELDLHEAYRWYDERSPGLGGDFLLAIDDGISVIREYPESCPIVYQQIRRALIKRFPYGLYFLLEKERIVIIAVFHASRNPKIWQDRDVKKLS